MDGREQSERESRVAQKQPCVKAKSHPSAGAVCGASWLNDADKVHVRQAREIKAVALGIFLDNHRTFVYKESTVEGKQ